MGHFYIDDSVHDEAGFIIGACVYTNSDVDMEINTIVKSHGFDNGNFEFKSNTNYTKEPGKAKVREDLKQVLYNHCKLGVVIIPREYRDRLGFECIKAIKQFVDANKKLNKPLSVYFDQGMFQSTAKAEQLISALSFTDCNFFLEQDSKKIKGIQLADLSAHIASIQFKHRLGLVIKKVKPAGNSGYDSYDEMELGFEMWAILRYSFFYQSSGKLYMDEQLIDATMIVEPCGLYISDLGNQEFTENVRATIGTVYLGCIH